MNKKIEAVIAKINSTVGTNNSPVYNSHLYWSQKPYNICDILIQGLSEKNDVVCDPFMGSGVTIFEAVSKKNSRRAIGIEVNDYPIYLLKTLLEKHSLSDFEFEAQLIIEKINQLQNDIYNSMCPICGHENIIDKSMFEYGSAGEKVLTNVFYKCERCGAKIETPSKEDFINFNKFNNDNFEYFKNIDLIPDSRIAVRENETLHDIFTKRNLKALDSILRVIENTKYHDLYIYSLLGVMHLCKITDPKSSSQWPLWTPNKDCVEKNVFNLFLKSLNKTICALRSADSELPKNRSEAFCFEGLNTDSYLIVKNGTQFVDSSIIPDASVDLIITDPPYMGQVIYSEYMQLYKPLLKTEIEYDKEIIVIKTKERTKTEKDFFKDLGLAFKQISRMLKPDKYLCVYFHDANLKIWKQLIQIMDDADLSFEGITHVNKGKSTLKNIVSPKKSMNGDAILFFTKKKPNYLKQTNLDEEECVKIACSIIENNGGFATTAQLYDNGVLEYIIKKGMLDFAASQYGDLTELFTKYFKWNDNGGLWSKL